MKKKISYRYLRKLVSEAISTSRDTGDRISAAISDVKNQRALTRNRGRDTSRIEELLDDCIPALMDMFENVTWWDIAPKIERTINDEIECAMEEYSTGTKEEEDDLAGRSTFNPTFQVEFDRSDELAFMNACNDILNSIARANGLSKIATAGESVNIRWNFIDGDGASLTIEVKDKYGTNSKRVHIPVDDDIKDNIGCSEKALFIMGVMKKLKEAGYRISSFDDENIWFKLGDSVDEGIIPARQIMSKIGSQQVDESRKVTLTIGQLKRLARSSRRRLR